MVTITPLDATIAVTHTCESRMQAVSSLRLVYCFFLEGKAICCHPGTCVCMNVCTIQQLRGCETIDQWIALNDMLRSADSDMLMEHNSEWQSTALSRSKLQHITQTSFVPLIQPHSPSHSELPRPIFTEISGFSQDAHLQYLIVCSCLGTDRLCHSCSERKCWTRSSL